jgi:WD40 repeat protein
MRMGMLVSIGLSFAVLESALAQADRTAESVAPSSVSFSKDIAPVLLKKCLTCHGAEKSKGGYRLDTFELLMKGGDSKTPAITPGEPDQSKLFELVTATDEDDRMPQKDDPLPADQIALIERWINEGAKFDGSDPKALLVTQVPKAPHPAPPAVYRKPVPVLALAFNRSGEELATGGYHEILVWNSADGQLLRRITNVAQRTQSLAYSPDGSLLAAAGGTPGQLGEVALFDPATGSVVNVLGSMPDMALAARFSPDGTRLAVGGADNSIRVYEVADAREQLVIQQHADWVMSVAWSPDGAQLASASRDRTARVYDTKTGDLEATYTGHTGPIFDVAFSSDGKLVYSGGRDKKIHVWEAKDGKKSGEINGFEDEIYKLLVLDDALFSVSADRRVRQHSVGKKELVRTYSGHGDVVYSVALQNKRLATGSYDGEVRVWTIEDGRLLASFVAAPAYTSSVQRTQAP